MRDIFKQKPRYSYEVGGGAFRFDFYINEKKLKENYLHITTPSGAFEQTVRNYAFGYLLAASRQGKMSELEAYGLMLHRLSDEIYQDLTLCQDIIKAINNRDKRLKKEAERNAKNVTEAEEMGAQAYMEDVVAFSNSNASPKERKRMGRESREEMRQILNESKK